MVTKFGECKKERLCKCLIFDNLQSLVCARDGDTLLGEGTHIRYIVPRQKFLPEGKG